MVRVFRFVMLNHMLNLFAQQHFFFIDELSNNEVFEDGIPADEISKRAIESARVTFRKLKSTFVSLAANKGSSGRPGPPGFVGRPGPPGPSSKETVMGQSKKLSTFKGIISKQLYEIICPHNRFTKQ